MFTSALPACVPQADVVATGADVAAAVNSICPDSEQQPDPEALERKLFRMLEKRGAKAALEGWRLSTKDEGL